MFDFNLLISLMKKRVVLIIFCVTLTSFLTMVLTNLQTEIYLANSKLLIDMESANVLNMNDVIKIGDNNFWSFREYLKSQCEIIQSKELAEKVINQMNLWDTVYRPGLLKRLKSYLTPIININLFANATGNAEKISHAKIIEQFLEPLKVENLRDTRIVKLSYEHSDPKMAQSILNQWIDQYIQQNLNIKVKASEDARKWLIEEKNRLYAILTLKEIRVHEFRQKNNFISPDERQVIINTSLNDLNEKIVEARSLLAEYQQRYQIKHPKMTQLLKKKEEIENLLVATRLKAIEFEKKLAEFTQIQREIELNQKMLESVLTREKELIITSSMQNNNISVVEYAYLPEKPIRPKKLLNLIISIIIGFILSLIIISISYLSNTTIENENDILTLGFNVLGSIPFIEKSFFKQKNYRDAYLMINNKGIISELFNHLRTSIILKTKDQNKTCQTMLITSFLPGEGKTTISSNLAVGLAKYSYKVLLIEADLRKPRVSEAFNLDKNKGGLSDYLSSNDASLEQLIQPSNLNGLDVLPCGKIPENPSELLGNNKVDKLMERLSSMYDFILFDCPPFLSVTDPIILAEKIKNIILVAKYKSTPKKYLSMAKEKIELSQGKIVGVILNQIPDPRKSNQLEYVNYYQSNENK